MIKTVWRRFEDIIYLKKNPRIFRFVTFPLEILDKAKLYPWKFPGQKQRLSEIQHDFYLITPRNSTSFSIDPWNFHMIFLLYPWKLHALNHPWLDFFWNSPQQYLYIFISLSIYTYSAVLVCPIVFNTLIVCFILFY